MSQEIVDGTVAWLGKQTQDESLELTFHGGEPLMAGVEFYRYALPRLASTWKRAVAFSIQSNLWRLDENACDLFKEYSLSLGTSLDGPEEINDAQRGKGYFRRTMAGIDLARSRQIPVGCIVTFTAQSLPRWREVVQFFQREGLSFSIHAALPGMNKNSQSPWVVSGEQYGSLQEEVFAYYIEHMEGLRIPTLDAICRSLSTGKGGMCTFGECLGSYLAVGPDGSIYPCQRFVGMEEYRLGNVVNNLSLDESPVWKLFSDRQKRIEQECSGCSFLDICKGGCPYNALVAGGAGFAGGLRDPYCPGYKRIFQVVIERAAEEFFTEDNLAMVVEDPFGSGKVRSQAPVLGLVRGAPHPSETAQHARQTLAVTALAASDSVAQAASRLRKLGMNGRQLESSLDAMHKRLDTPRSLRNNVYLHVTFACTQNCSHCYARAGGGQNAALPLEAVLQTVHEAARLGFRHAVITGGEPLLYHGIDALSDALQQTDGQLRPLKTVLRTSLAQAVPSERLARIAVGFDEVVVSLDGDEVTHDLRRGAGSYARTVDSLRKLVQIEGKAEVSLACVLPLAQSKGAEGESVRTLAKQLGIRRVRFRPVLPLGRAAFELPDLPSEAVWASLSAEDRVAYGFLPTASCGIGQNVYIEPDGVAYPCYAWHGQPWQLGNLYTEGLAGLVEKESFQSLSRHTVNSNRRCRTCSLRYLCGGACRAWNRQPAEEQIDLDASPLGCSNLFNRARGLLLSSLHILSLDLSQWMEAGFPDPEEPPFEI
jgi:uncharacterized protein